MVVASGDLPIIGQSVDRDDAHSQLLAMASCGNKLSGPTDQ
jgi:hypothetical protein